MAHMILQVEKFRAYHVRCEEGDCIVAYDDVWSIPDQYHPPVATLEALRPYCPDGAPLSYNLDEPEGRWYGRYSAPGYLDCTEWLGPFDSEEEAEEETRALYGDEEDEDDGEPPRHGPEGDIDLFGGADW